MAYATITQLSDRLGATLYARLTDRVGGTTPSTSVAQALIDEAEAEANSYLARRYATPVDLAAHPELAALLASKVLDLAEYAAWRGSPFISDPPQRVRAIQQAALHWFESVARGEVALPAAPPPAPTAARDEGPYYTSAPRAFTPDELDTL